MSKLCEFAEVHLVHVALLDESVVECVGGSEVVPRLTLLRDLEVVPEELLVVRMCAVFDDGMSTFDRALTTQVGYTLFGNDDVYIMFCVVNVTAEWYDGRNGTALSYR